jgi:hypothetical protein
LLFNKKFFCRTITALRSNDRPDAINRLLHKSDHSLLLVANVLLNLEESIESEIFLEYLRKLIDNHSSESIVFDLLNIYCQKYPDEQEKILELLQTKDKQQDLPIQQTNQLLLILKLFPDSILIAEKIYKSLIKRIILFFKSSKKNNP